MKRENKFTTPAVNSGLITVPIAVAVANSHDSSDWFRLPPPKQRLWGMSRTTWNELCDDGKVKFIVVRKKHAQRGIKLIFRPSAEAYFKGLLDAKGS